MITLHLYKKRAGWDLISLSDIVNYYDIAGRIRTVILDTENGEYMTTETKELFTRDVMLNYLSCIVEYDKTISKINELN